MDPRALKHYYSPSITGIDIDSLPQLREHHCGAVCWFRGPDSWQDEDGKAHRCKRRQRPQERQEVPVPPKPVGATTFAKASNESSFL